MNNRVKLLLAIFSFLLVLTIGGWRIVTPSSELQPYLSVIKYSVDTYRNGKHLANPTMNLYLYEINENIHIGVVNIYKDPKYGYLSSFIALLVLGIPFRIFVF